MRDKRPPATTRAEWEERERERKLDARIMREGEANTNYGMTTGAARCPSCKKFKSTPATVCGWCGNDPVATDERTYNRAHGRAA